MNKNDSPSVGILGVGSYVPEKILTNRDLEKLVDTSDEWIKQRTGISERRILEDDKPIYSMGVISAKKAIKDAGINPEEIGMIIVTSSSPDYITPPAASRIQAEIGAVNAASFDLSAACTGSIYGLTIGQQFIKTGYYDYVLVVAVECMSRVTDWTDRNTCVLFGDGSGAIVLGKVDNGYGILSSYLDSNGEMAENITIPCLYLSDEDKEKRSKYKNKHAIWQDGKEVFKFAIQAMPLATQKVLDDAGMTVDDLKFLIPHQANNRIIESAAKKLGIDENHVYVTIEKYGNTSSASVIMALEDAYLNNHLTKGDNLVLVGFGAGLTWGAALVKWNK